MSQDRPCKVENCVRSQKCRQLCSMHYARWRRNGDVGTPEGFYDNRPSLCRVDGCEGAVACRGLCGMHYERFRKDGDPGSAEPRVLRGYSGPCLVTGCTGKPKYRRYCGPHYWKWRAYGDPTAGKPKSDGYVDKRTGYVYVYVTGRGSVLEHRLIMERILGRDLLPEENVHHLNGNRGDNRPENLELWRVAQPTGQRVSDLIDYLVAHHRNALLVALDAASLGTHPLPRACA